MFFCSSMYLASSCVIVQVLIKQLFIHQTMVSKQVPATQIMMSRNNNISDTRYLERPFQMNYSRICLSMVLLRVLKWWCWRACMFRVWISKCHVKHVEEEPTRRCQLKQQTVLRSTALTQKRHIMLVYTKHTWQATRKVIIPISLQIWKLLNEWRLTWRYLLYCANNA